MELYEAFILSRKYLRDKGWFNTRQFMMPMDAHKNPLPWLTYPAIYFLDERLNDKKLSVFEYGSGKCTLWMVQRVKKIVSVEYDPKYYQIVQEKLKPFDNIDYRLAELGKDYWQQIEEFQKSFDVIFIDGRERVQCTLHCLPALKDDGVIIWDNSDREEYKEAYDFLDQSYFKRIDFQGHGPIGHVEWKTTIYYKAGNCLGI